MGDHRDWYKPIYFVDFDLEGCIRIPVAIVAYGKPNWPNRSYWLVPGTVEE